MAYFRKKSFRFPSQPFSIQLRQPFFNVGLSPTPHQQKRRTPLVKNTIQGKNLLAAKNSLPTIFNFLLILVFMVRLKWPTLTRAKTEFGVRETFWGHRLSLSQWLRHCKSKSKPDHHHKGFLRQLVFHTSHLCQRCLSMQWKQFCKHVNLFSSLLKWNKYLQLFPVHSLLCMIDNVGIRWKGLQFNVLGDLPTCVIYLNILKVNSAVVWLAQSWLQIHIIRKCQSAM